MKDNYIAVCKEKNVAGINIEKVLPYYQAVQSSTSEGSTWLYQPKGKGQRLFDTNQTQLCLVKL